MIITLSKNKLSAKIIKSSDKVQKALTKTAINDDYSSSIWLEPSFNLKGLKEYVSHSTILPQCIEAYKDNICGFGLSVRYKEDIEETEEMKKEYDMLLEILDKLNLDMDTKDVFQDIVVARETYGIAYVEVIRNLKGEISEIEHINDVDSIRKTSQLDENVPFKYFYKGEEIQRTKQFCKYKQEKNGKTVYFKEMSDPRIMDKRTGEYVQQLELDYQANEILEFAIGNEPYGMVRYIGQILNVEGSRMAENLNYTYFTNGRHTPMMLVVKGGSLTDDSYTKLQEYMNGIKGEQGQHSFMVLEVEDNKDTILDSDKAPSVEVKDMASILQKDELFQDYLDNNRRKIQSSFRLPDLYVGYTTDFNRATAQTVQELTEQQVFVPERISLAWIINNKLLNEFKFKYVEAYFKEPIITNPDDVTKYLNICERAGGITPNVAREIVFNALGKQAENYDDEFGNTPLAVLKKGK